jgi:hypothetical protein
LDAILRPGTRGIRHYQVSNIVRQTADHVAGVAAFKEKRTPKFTGR